MTKHDLKIVVLVGNTILSFTDRERFIYLIKRLILHGRSVSGGYDVGTGLLQELSLAKMQIWLMVH